MIFLIDGIKWKVWWAYYEPYCRDCGQIVDSSAPSCYTYMDYRPRTYATKGIRTICYIKRLTDYDSDDVRMGFVTCAKGDRFEKEVGRRLSLTKALSAFYDSDSRRVAWGAYFNRGSNV